MLHSPANLLITDPEGRRIGFDNTVSETVNEIPTATYYGPYTEPEIVCVESPSTGAYSVQLTGTENASFTLDAQLASLSAQAQTLVIDGRISKGQTLDYYVNYENDSLKALALTISPTSVTLNANQSQLFNSTVSGGTSPYSYQWYLNGSTVPGATNATWTFTPTSAGSYTLYVNVTDAVGAQATSNTAAITALPTIPEFPSYLVLPFFMVATLLAAFVLKRKRNVRTQ